VYYPTKGPSKYCIILAEFPNQFCLEQYRSLVIWKIIFFSNNRKSLVVSIVGFDSKNIYNHFHLHSMSTISMVEIHAPISLHLFIFTRNLMLWLVGATLKGIVAKTEFNL
jgi:hypothetical protein